MDFMVHRTGVGPSVICICVLSCVTCNRPFAGHESHVMLAVFPNPALMDERITIKAAGLRPDHEVMIRTRSRDQSDCWWSSSAVFRTRQDGSVDVSRQAPVSGGYADADAMGLFWSMEPDAYNRPPD